jgi:hypothetical protein
MKRITLRFAIAALTFIVGILAATLWFVYRKPINIDQHNSAVDSPLSFCDLLRNPDGYDGKIIRVRAAIAGYHHQHLFDQSCSSEQTQTLVDYNSSDGGGKLIGKIAELPDQKIKEGNLRAELIVIGRFESSNVQRIAELMAWYGDEKMQQRVHPVKDKFLFTIMEVEQVKICEPKLCG